MKDEIFLLIIGIFIIFWMGIFVGYNIRKDYKQGQIDAISGLVRYEPQTNADKTVSWKEIK
jgi:hypothetical protein